MSLPPVAFTGTQTTHFCKLFWVTAELLHYLLFRNNTQLEANSSWLGHRQCTFPPKHGICRHAIQNKYCAAAGWPTIARHALMPRRTIATNQFKNLARQANLQHLMPVHCSIDQSGNLDRQERMAAVPVPTSPTTNYSLLRRELSSDRVMRTGHFLR